MSSNEPTAEQRSLLEITRRAIRDTAIQDFPAKEVRSVIDDMLSRQNEDPEWTTKVIEALGRLPQLEADDTMSLNEARCYETMCRVVTTHANMQESSQFWEEAMEDDDLLGPARRYASPVDSNTVESVLYVGRYGEDAQVHDAVSNRMYELLTATKYEEIEPTPEQMARVAASMHQP